MTENRDFERRLRTWFDEDGPQDVPDRVVDVAIEEASSTRRKRPLPSFVVAALAGVETFAMARQVPLARAWVALALLLTLLVASAVLAGAFLFQVDRARTNGSIAFDVGGDIFTFDGRAGGEPIQLTDTIQIHEANPVYSPDGKYLAYWTTDAADSHSEIHVRDLQTGGTILLRDTDELLLPLEASIFGWSPDSTQIAAPARGASADGSVVGIETVVLFDVETGSVEQIPLEEPAWSFGWSPDGRLLGLVGSEDLFIYDIEPSEIKPLRGTRAAGETETPFWLRDIPPVFSDDSRAVLLTDERTEDGSTGDIWLFSIDDPSNEPVVISSSNELAPVVSLDGNHLAYGRSPAVTISGALGDGYVAPDLGSELIVMNASGGPETSVATNVWPRAAWSPDSRRLVTKSFDGGELVVIDLDRPDDPVRLPVHEEVGGYSWGPRPP